MPTRMPRPLVVDAPLRLAAVRRAGRGAATGRRTGASARQGGARRDAGAPHAPGTGRPVGRVEQGAHAEHRRAEPAAAVHARRAEGVQQRLERSGPDDALHLPRRAARQQRAVPDADRPAPRQGGLPLRVHAQLPGDLHRRAHAPQGLGTVAAGPFGRAVGGRHAGHRHDQPHRPDVARRPRQPPQRRDEGHRAVAAHQRQPDPVPRDASTTRSSTRGRGPPRGT